MEDPRKQGLAYHLRQHPALTPGAVADSIQNASDTSLDNPGLAKTDPMDPFMSFMATMTRAIIEKDAHHGVFHVTQPGQYFNRPQILVNSITNLAEGGLVIGLAEGETLPGNLVVRTAFTVNDKPATNLKYQFNRAMVVRQIYTTTGVATATLTIGGTWAAGRVYSVSVFAVDPATPMSSRRIQRTFSYTSGGGDLGNTGAGNSFAAAWNADAQLASLATAASVGGVITLTATNAGSLIQQSRLAASATGASTFVETQFIGAANPNATIAFS